MVLPEISSEVFSNAKNSILLPNFLYKVWVKSYPHVNTNVEISCLNRNNFGIIKFIKILATKSNSLALKCLWTNFRLSPSQDEREYSFLLTSPSAQKQLSLVQNIMITLASTVNKH